jgi:lipoate-protein ligase B
VWTGSKKIAAVGVQFSGGVSAHGAALNVSVDTGWFQRIVPCGDPEATVTTMSEVLQRPIGVASVQHQLVQQFMREHGCDQWDSLTPDQLLEECMRSST